MFKRVFFEEWTLVIPAIAFCFFFSVFIYATLRTMQMKKAKREKMASLPLE